MSDYKGKEGLGGWLILVAFKLVTTPILMFLQVGEFTTIFEDGTWEQLTTPSSEYYHSLWGIVIFGEIVLNIGLVILSFVLLYKFFRKSRSFPSWFIFGLIFHCAFLFIDALAIKLVLPSEPMFDPDTTKDFGKAVASAIIWIPYMLISKRVKNTFVR